MFQMDRLSLGAERWFAKSQSGVGRLSPDPGLPLVGGARANA